MTMHSMTLDRSMFSWDYQIAPPLCTVKVNSWASLDKEDQREEISGGPRVSDNVYFQEPHPAGETSE